MENEVIRHCPHCGNTAPQKLAFEHEYEDREFYDIDGAPADLSLSCRYEARSAQLARILSFITTTSSQNGVLFFRQSTP